MTQTNRWIAAAVMALAAAGCKKPADDGSPTPPAGAGAGLEDTSNDKAVVALAKDAIKCGWQDGSGVKTPCPALDAWNKSEIIKGGKVDATLLNFLGDAQKEARWIGAYGLYNAAQAYRTDAAMAKRLLAAGRAEKDATVARKLGDAIGKINVSKTGTTDELKKLLAESSQSTLRQGIVDGVLFNNRSEGGFYDLLATMARTEKDKAVRKTAASAFWVGGSERHDDTCKLWLELSDDPDDDLSGNSAYHTSWWSSGGGCTGQWDALLGVIEKRAKAGKVKSSFMTSALGWLQKQGKATDAQKKRAMAVAKTIVETASNDRMARGDALRVIGENDPDAKKFASRFESDPEFFVKSAAQRIKEGKK
ncbi:MAG: hypothetical protein ABI193_22710 [Minicystis sp.]